MPPSSQAMRKSSMTILATSNSKNSTLKFTKPSKSITNSAISKNPATATPARNESAIKRDRVDDEEEKVPTAASFSQAASEMAVGSSTMNDKYYKKFDFFYKRTCFRLMSEFYKLLFSPFQKQWVEQKKKSSMSALLIAFASKHFEAIFTKLNEENQTEFLKMLMAVVHSHRHNKEDHATDGTPAAAACSSKRKASE